MRVSNFFRRHGREAQIIDTMISDCCGNELGSQFFRIWSVSGFDQAKNMAMRDMQGYALYAVLLAEQLIEEDRALIQPEIAGKEDTIVM